MTDNTHRKERGREKRTRKKKMSSEEPFHRPPPFEMMVASLADDACGPVMAPVLAALAGRVGEVLAEAGVTAVDTTAMCSAVAMVTPAPDAPDAAATLMSMRT
jgi:hypothetical protein